MDILGIGFGGFLFDISASSFYQVNPIQTEKLYDLAVSLAGLKEDDVVFDLYSGIGTIGIFASKYVKMVYGIEIVKEAVENAKNNARVNDVQNIKFFAGDVEEILANLIDVEMIRPSVVFVDPPRKGLDETSTKNLLRIRPDRIVYISCNPASLMRDLARLEGEYDVMRIVPVDLFPFTGHVECVAVVRLRNNGK